MHSENVNLILYDRENADMVSRATGLFNKLIEDSAAHGYGEYRVGVTRYADFHVASGIAREQGRSVIAAVVHEGKGGANRLIAGSSAGLWAYADRLSGAFDAAIIRRLIREPGSIAWVCA